MSVFGQSHAVFAVMALEFEFRYCDTSFLFAYDYFGCLFSFFKVFFLVL